VDFQLITCVVERGRAEHVADVALGAGAQGVTIYAARGRGVRERLMFLGHLIDPEKEVVLTVCRNDQGKRIFDAIVEAARIDQPGKGFVFVQDVARVAGFLTDRNLTPGRPARASRARKRAPAAKMPKRRRGR
jgi:nitrogen regulatory protein PII